MTPIRHDEGRGTADCPACPDLRERVTRVEVGLENIEQSLDALKTSMLASEARGERRSELLVNQFEGSVRTLSAQVLELGKAVATMRGVMAVVVVVGNLLGAVIAAVVGAIVVQLMR